MTVRQIVILAAAAVAAAACQKKQPAPGTAGADPSAQGAADSLPVVVLETSMGRIVMQLDRGKAPLTVQNIVAHVNLHFYDGLTFHRVIKGFMIQAGVQLPDGRQRLSSAPPVPNEADNGLKNTRGAVALARTADPNSGGTQFFINLVDNPRLDFRSKTTEGWGYAVFGRVTQGMDVVDAIGAVRTRSDDVPVEPVVITRAYVDTSAAAP
jgi:cyclophilin family peptidyl-prolyl cis-trans isomerase